MDNVNEVKRLLEEGYSCIEVSIPCGANPNSIIECAAKFKKGDQIVKLNIEGKDKFEVSRLFAQYNQHTSV